MRSGGKEVDRSRQTVSVEYVVFAGYAGAKRIFDNEAHARAYYDNEASVPSYLNRAVMQPASLIRVTTSTEVLEHNRDAIALDTGYTVGDDAAEG